MAFHEVRFDKAIAFRSRFAVSRNVRVLELPSGEREASARWSRSLRRYDVSKGISSLSDLLAVRDFYMLRGGPLNEFRFKDWSDFTSASDHIGDRAKTDQLIGVGDNSETKFQIKKTYTDGTYTESRNITKLDSEFPVLVDDIGGVAQVESTHFTVDYTTGIITFTTAPGVSNDVKCGYNFDVPVAFGEELDTLLSLSYDAYDSGTLGSIPLVEILNPDPIPADFYFGGGAINHGTLGANFQVSLSSGQAVRVTPSTSIDAILPDTTTLHTGPALFYITNDHATNALEIKDYGGSTVTTLSGTLGDTAILSLTLDSSGNKEWTAI